MHCYFVYVQCPFMKRIVYESEARRNKSDNFNVLANEYMKNACTLVPTVSLRQGKTEFELPVSFIVYPCHRKAEFVFCFPTTLKMEFQLLIRFAPTLDDRFQKFISFFRLPSLYDIENRNSNFDFRLPFL